MSCKVFKGNSAAQPVVWQTVGDAAPSRYHASSPPLSPEAGEEFERRLVRVNQTAEARIAEARSAGFGAGRSTAEAELEPVLQRVTRSLAELASSRAVLRKQAEADLVKLAIAIARRILRRELSVDPDALQGIVLAALDRLQLRDLCRVRIHPSQEAAIRRHLESAGVRNIEIVADHSLEGGAVIFESGRGTLDASIESQLREIERGFTDTLRK